MQHIVKDKQQCLKIFLAFIPPFKLLTWFNFIYLGPNQLKDYRNIKGVVEPLVTF